MRIKNENEGHPEMIESRKPVTPRISCTRSRDAAIGATAKSRGKWARKPPRFAELEAATRDSWIGHGLDMDWTWIDRENSQESLVSLVFVIV